MSGIFKKFGFSSECKECNSADSLRKCPHCGEIICTNCLERLVLRSSWPAGLKGKKVESYDGLKNILLGYCDMFRSKNAGIHCCEEYVQYRWKDMEALIAQQEAQGKRINVVLK